MNQHKPNCQISSQGWTASVPPFCTCYLEDKPQKVEEKFVNLYDDNPAMAEFGTEIVGFIRNLLKVERERLWEKIEKMRLDVKSIDLENQGGYKEAIDEILKLIK